MSHGPLASSRMRKVVSLGVSMAFFNVALAATTASLPPPAPLADQPPPSGDPNSALFPPPLPPSSTDSLYPNDPAALPPPDPSLSAHAHSGDRSRRSHARHARRQRPERKPRSRPPPGPTANPTETSITPQSTPSRQNSTTVYTLVDSYEGTTFFDQWDFFDTTDPTNGMITYVSAADAMGAGLAYVRDDGVAVMTVDTTTTLASGDYRKSVRITSKKAYNKGLFVFDILKGPYGCSVWPAAWLVGPSWPAGGEIDVVEGVHENIYNQMTVHSSAGCTLDASKALTAGSTLKEDQVETEVFTGTILATTCDASENSNTGCGILDSDTRSYGAGLNDAGGGVYATLWDDIGVRIWFFAREDVSADITAQDPDPTTWGSPKAYWATTACASSFFSDLSIVFDIVLGGDWAGATFSST
ncbi:hypothetical protein FRC15_006262 [Serendipita sp. 397]|nr:hypothetical protein FRC15_006262 [Serendipita sp. 397]